MPVDASGDGDWFVVLILGGARRCRWCPSMPVVPVNSFDCRWFPLVRLIAGGACRCRLCRCLKAVCRWCHRCWWCRRCRWSRGLCGFDMLDGVAMMQKKSIDFNDDGAARMVDGRFLNLQPHFAAFDYRKI
ncbi:hypothetical protein Hanom_Chr04g00340051 [Helianthus anomalus]